MITCVDMCGTSPDAGAISRAFAFAPFAPVVVAMRAERLVELQQLFAEFALEARHPDAERVVLHLGGCPIRVDPAVPADEIWLVPPEGEPFKIVHLRPVVAPLEAVP